MKVFCLDTNAILDFCYRFYPQYIFNDLWESMDAAIIARQIKFVITKDIYTEVILQIKKADYDPSVFDNFKTKFCVQIIDDYDAELAQLKVRLMQIAKNFPPAKLNLLHNDLSNICVYAQHRHHIRTGV